MGVHGLSECGLGAAAQVVPLRVLADEQCEFDSRHVLQQSRVPFGCEARSGWQVAVGALAGVVEVHRQQGDIAWVVERLGGQSEPAPECYTASVAPRYAGQLGASAGRLPDDDDSGVPVCGVQRLPTLVGSPRIVRVRDDG